jgi:hypothetical protein
VGSLHRSHSPASQAPADHPPAAGVNRDASLFYRAPGIDLVERRGGVAPMDHFGNAVRHTEANSVGLAGSSLRHNKSGRDRSSCRSQPAADSPRTGTAALTLPRHGTPTRLLDERHDCQDIGPAYVPRHGVGHGVEPNRQVQISAPCWPLDTDKPTPGQPAVVFIGARVATNATPITLSISDTPSDVSNLERPTSLHTVRRRAPDKRGFRPPSTPMACSMRARPR